MSEKNVTPAVENSMEQEGLVGKKLTRAHLSELERKQQTKKQKVIDFIITLLPMIGYLFAMGEYLFIPDKYNNANPERYMIFLTVPIVLYIIFWVKATLQYKKGDKVLYDKVRYKAPFYTALYLLLLVYDYCSLKTGILTQPFIPWINDIINAAILDYKELLKCTLFTLRLLFLGYFSGVVAGLITGIACGYSTKVRYWIQPLIQVFKLILFNYYWDQPFD